MFRESQRKQYRSLTKMFRTRLFGKWNTVKLHIRRKSHSTQRTFEKEEREDFFAEKS